jgi:hypothetical protein
LGKFFANRSGLVAFIEITFWAYALSTVVTLGYLVPSITEALSQGLKFRDIDTVFIAWSFFRPLAAIVVIWAARKYDTKTFVQTFAVFQAIRWIIVPIFYAVLGDSNPFGWPLINLPQSLAAIAHATDIQTFNGFIRELISALFLVQIVLGLVSFRKLQQLETTHTLAVDAHLSNESEE